MCMYIYITYMCIYIYIYNYTICVSMMIHGNHILIELCGFELYGFIEYGWFLCHIAHTYIYIVSSNRLYQICVSWLKFQTSISPWAIRNAVRQSSDAASQDWKVGCFLEFCECVASLAVLNMEDPKTMGTPHLGKHPFGMIPNRSIFNIYIYIYGQDKQVSEFQ